MLDLSVASGFITRVGPLRRDRPVGICGGAPSTVPGYVEFLLNAGSDSISPDVALATIRTVADLESTDG
ncbi:hypothetical protein ACKVMT_02755 [Halobacteriales archaeon Cl-PHB]